MLFISQIYCKKACVHLVSTSLVESAITSFQHSTGILSQVQKTADKVGDSEAEPNIKGTCSKHETNSPASCEASRGPQ
ncbi:hypothetical protein KC345_g184 [Hortaea werneckii]|nr:hypothetical protein KC345_g184 [Hortaea werneckii]